MCVFIDILFYFIHISDLIGRYIIELLDHEIFDNGLGKALIDAINDFLFHILEFYTFYLFRIRIGTEKRIEDFIIHK